MALERKKTLNVFKDAKASWGSYDEYPVGPRGTDPMPHLSRNRVPQPFFAVCSEDQVLIQMAGEGLLEVREHALERVALTPGDAIYIPAGVPTRMVPTGENVQVRLRADPPPPEAVAWYCDACGALVAAFEIDGAELHDGWHEAVTTFNADAKVRACACGKVHPPVDLGDIAWPAVAAALRADD